MIFFFPVYNFCIFQIKKKSRKEEKCKWSVFLALNCAPALLVFLRLRVMYVQVPSCSYVSLDCPLSTWMFWFCVNKCTYTHLS